MTMGPAPKIQLYAGLRLGWLCIERRSTKKGKHAGQLWQCRCDCGNKVVVPTAYLTRDSYPTRHCGCKKNPDKNPYPREKGIWNMMHVRCEDPRHVAYKHYGGATPPIKICPEWHKSNPNGWANFIRDMGPAPSKKHSLDRINPTEGYMHKLPDGTLQCRWADADTQANNQKRHWYHRLALKEKAKTNGTDDS